MYQLWNQGIFQTECKEEIYYDDTQRAWWTPGAWYTDPYKQMNVVYVEPQQNEGPAPNVVG